MRVMNAVALAALLLATASGTSTAQDKPADAAASVAVGPQYDTAHVYVVPEDVDRFSDSVIATFGGTRSQQAALTITPTPSRTMRQAVFTPVGTFSVFGFTTPIPHPFGLERTGYLVTDMDTAIRSGEGQRRDPVTRTPCFRGPCRVSRSSAQSSASTAAYERRPATARWHRVRRPCCGTVQ
jgi:hypothetical protein